MSLLADKSACLIGLPEYWDHVNALPVRTIFHSSVLDFLDDLSRSILSDIEAHKYPDVVAFAIWCRRSALTKQQAQYADGSIYLGRGLAFHVSPANVPIMFAYTLAIGLLAGNANIVRLPSRVFPQVDYLCGRIVALLTLRAHIALANHVICVRYDREAFDVTRFLSELCDVRVIWGGDSSVRQIREAPLRPGAFDVVFPNRYSIAVIQSEAWLNCADKKRHIRDFYNDTYLSDHASCSSPRLVLWVGERIEVARVSFWSLLEELVAERYEPVPAKAVSNLEVSYSIAARYSNATLCSKNSLVTRVWCDDIDADVLERDFAGGVFLETGAPTLDALARFLRRGCQTISYFGVSVDRLTTLLCETGARGGDRVVPMGRTLDFSLTWDGYDTIRTLSRKLDVIMAPGTTGEESRGELAR